MNDSNAIRPAATEINAGEGPEIKPAKERCRFEMFVRLRPDTENTFLNGQRSFTFRGDRYEKERTAKMLTLLLNQFLNYHHQYLLVMIFDTSKPKDDGERLIFKYINGVVTMNRLDQYKSLLKNYYLPAILRQP